MKPVLWLLVLAVILLIAGGMLLLRDSDVRVTDADWFVLSPEEELIAVGRRGGIAFVGRDGAAHGAEVPAAAACEVVFLADQTALLVDSDAGRGTIRVRDPAGAMTEAASLPLAPGNSLRPVLNGGRHSGILGAGQRLVLEEGTDDAVAALYLFDPAARSAPVPVPLAAVHGAAKGVSVAPDGSAIAVIASRAAQPDRPDIVVLAPDGALLHVVTDVAPVLPYWLVESNALLFEARIGGISRFSLADGDTAFLCDGELPRDVAREHVARRNLADPFVLIEKVDLKDFLQIARVWPFETRVKQENITTGGIHHFGLDVERDHRYFAFRKFQPGRSTLDESVVLVQLGGAFPSETLCDRVAEPADDRLGPCFSAAADAVYYVDAGGLFRHDL